MKCEDVNRELVAMTEGTLDVSSEKRLRMHLDSCESCRNYSTFINKVFGQIDIEREVEVSSDFTEKILSRVPVRRVSVRRIRSVLSPVAAAAVILFGIFTGIRIADISTSAFADSHSDLPEEYYYTNEIHLETIEGFFLSNDESYEKE